METKHDIETTPPDRAQKLAEFIDAEARACQRGGSWHFSHQKAAQECADLANDALPDDYDPEQDNGILYAEVGGEIWHEAEQILIAEFGWDDEFGHARHPVLGYLADR